MSGCPWRRSSVRAPSGGRCSRPATSGQQPSCLQRPDPRRSAPVWGGPREPRSGVRPCVSVVVIPGDVRVRPRGGGRSAARGVPAGLTGPMLSVRLSGGPSGRELAPPGEGGLNLPVRRTTPEPLPHPSLRAGVGTFFCCLRGWGQRRDHALPHPGAPASCFSCSWSCFHVPPAIALVTAGWAQSAFRAVSRSPRSRRSWVFSSSVQALRSRA